MIELQDDGIWLAAIDAWVLPEIRPSAILILSRGSLVVQVNAGNLVLAIPHIPITLVLRHTTAAPRL
jgi:hypothetical protein